MERAKGFYWVRGWDVGPYPELKMGPGIFQIAYWDGQYWRFCGDETTYPDTSLYSIAFQPIVEPIT